MKIDQLTFKGIVVPLITPFFNGKVDFESLEKLCEHYIKQQADGFVLCGTTGESAMLSHEEKDAIIELVIARYSNQLPILVGISASSTAVAVEEAKAIERAGGDGLLVLTPPYVKPSQEGIYQHFKHIAETVSIPIVIYNIPYRTGVNIQFETTRRMSALKNIIGIKECGGDMSQLMDIIRHTDLRFFTGEDHLLFVTSCLGGQGAISAAAHVCLPAMKATIELINAGELKKARETFNSILDTIRACFAAPNPGPVKAMLYQQGLIRSNEVRLPLLAV